ncbi:MAG TPA: metallophosphoesterase family protein, partial [Verrucomicrobiae bacterium]
VILYLNGVEIYRNNMPAGLVDSHTFAVTNVFGAGESTFYSIKLDTSLLAPGINFLAAEVHQAGSDSIDLSFDASLSASNVVLITRGPYLQQGSETGIVVRWRSDRGTESLVKYGASLDNLAFSVHDSALVTEHEMALSNLLPGTKYYYSVGFPGFDLGSGPDYYFVTAPATNKTTRIWALGDCGTANGDEQRVRDAYANFSSGRPTDVWLMLGDNAYSSGTDLEYQGAVFNMFPDMLRHNVLWTTIGNHETYSGIFDEFPYLHIFSPPRNAEAGGLPSGTKKYYSFNYANVHFLCLDSMTSDRSPSGAMMTWAQADLAANTNLWTIAFWHHPPYTKGSHDSDLEQELIEMRTNVLPILENYGVDLVLSGHSHCYERSYLLDGFYGYSWDMKPAYKLDAGSGRPEESGPYIKSGIGPSAHQGAVYIVAGSSGQISGGQLNHPAMFVSLNELGSLVLDVNGTSLQATFLRDNGLVRDHFTILKGITQRLRISEFNIEDELVFIAWTSKPGVTYRIQSSSSTTGNVWSDYTGNITATGNETSWYDFFDDLDPDRLFRVVVIQ